MQKKLLMVLGPTEVEREILDIASEPLEYMRTEDYSQKYKAYLLTLGYTTEDNITFVNETDKLRIDVVDDDGSNEFIHIYVLD